MICGEGQTIVRLTEATVVVAFSSWNLEAVARDFRTRYPQARIVIAGDNDHRKPLELGPDGKPKKNAGREAALAAAEAVNGCALLPEFELDEDGSDWNDRMRRYGADQVRSELLAGFEAAAGLEAAT